MHACALPPGSPIPWQPNALAPVFYGARTLGPADGAPVPLRVYFPSLDGAVESAPLLQGCGRYPLVILAHGHCIGDADIYLRWRQLPALLARAGCVVMVPRLAGIASGISPSLADHPDLATMDALLRWARTGWAERTVLMPAPATAIVGHSYGAMLGARFAVGRPVSAYAGLSGGWQDWFGGAPFPLPQLACPTLLFWGGASDLFSQLPDAQWQQMRKPRHRVVYAQGEHWDYLQEATIPCRGFAGPCPHIGAATADLLAMFLGRYVPPENADGLPQRIPATLAPPPLQLTPQQQFYAGGYLSGFAAMGGSGSCAVTVTQAVEQLVANKRSRETHSSEQPCAWVPLIAQRHRWPVNARPLGYHWCDMCFPLRADG